jgi:hypothetical protein
MNLFRKEFVMLVFPSGAKIDDVQKYWRVIMQMEGDC